jgi:hypothetical protein
MYIDTNRREDAYPHKSTGFNFPVFSAHETGVLKLFFRSNTFRLTNGFAFVTPLVAALPVLHSRTGSKGLFVDDNLNTRTHTAIHIIQPKGGLALSVVAGGLPV